MYEVIRRLFSRGGTQKSGEIIDQSQRVSGASTAVQSARDTNISHGITPADMRLIMDAIAGQISVYTASAKELVDVRLANFEERVIERLFSDEGARPEAFREPDFQYLIGRAQHAYARCDDAQVRDTLIDLIAERSKQDGRSRLSLSLNEAVERAAVLTMNEFAALSLIYIVRYTVQQGVDNFEGLATFIRDHVMPFVDDVSPKSSSFTYLEAQSCATISMGSVDLMDAFRRRYTGVLSHGFTKDELATRLPEGKKGVLDDSGLLIPCLNDASKWQLKVLNRDSSIDAAISALLTPNEWENVWNLFEGTCWTEAELVARLEVSIPGANRLFEIWNGTALKNLTLTSVGIAIAYTNVTRLTDFPADLSVWIQ